MLFQVGLSPQGRTLEDYLEGMLQAGYPFSHPTNADDKQSRKLKMSLAQETCTLFILSCLCIFALMLYYLTRIVENL